ncbi:MAG: glycosyltransferase family 8 protein [Acidimicrobiia bacterium]|nr:glycosyltransferase family 8 protein [Acidimicrobiia bacterium]MBV9411084.1 glycosyltransferase family 8 protein [Acidimicrobiia bacterium]
MPTSDAVHVAFASSAEFLPYCSVAMRSCLDHAPANTVVHLLHDGALTDHPRVEEVRAMVTAAGAELQVHGIDRDGLGRLPVNEQYRPVVFLYYLLPELLPDVERALYLDSDLLVEESVAPLFDTDLGDSPLGAIANVVRPEDRPRLASLGIPDHRRYLNSGVLLLDLDKWRRGDITSKLFEVATRRADEIDFADQDTLNLTLGDSWVAMHPRWNAQYTLWTDPDIAADIYGAEQVTEALASPAIVHFEGPGVSKPWHALNTHPRRSEWWATMARTPWAGTRPEDHGLVTSALRYLPERTRLRVYWQFAQWRKRRSRVR